jgi:hypothetical protein
MPLSSPFLDLLLTTPLNARLYSLWGRVQGGERPSALLLPEQNHRDPWSPQLLVRSQQQHTHCFRDGLVVLHLTGLRRQKKFERRAQAPSVGQSDGLRCGFTHCVAAKVDELLVKRQLSKDTSKPVWLLQATGCSGGARGPYHASAQGIQCPRGKGSFPSCQGATGAWFSLPLMGSLCPAPCRMDRAGMSTCASPLLHTQGHNPPQKS